MSMITVATFHVLLRYLSIRLERRCKVIRVFLNINLLLYFSKHFKLHVTSRQDLLCSLVDGNHGLAPITLPLVVKDLLRLLDRLDMCLTLFKELLADSYGI